MSKGGYQCVTETAFQASLSAFLKSLGLNVETLLRGVDFSQLSPAVNLISTVPGLCYVETDRNSFLFSAPKMTIFDGFGHFRFWPKMYFHFRLFFVFGQKRSNFRP